MDDETAAQAPAPSPLHTIARVIIGGCLGTGKTTLVNHLLRKAASRRAAVLLKDSTR